MDLSPSFGNDNLVAVKIFSGVLLLWIIGTAIYRVYLSPLSKIPGPKLAALTSWYEFYYDAVKGGQFTFHIQDLHRKYGANINSFARFRLTLARSNRTNQSNRSAHR
jgi:hypothetical protein